MVWFSGMISGRLFHQRKWILVAFLTIQWMISIVVLALDWFATNLAYLRRGDTAFDTAQTLYYLGFYAGKVPVVEWAFVTIQILLCNGFLVILHITSNLLRLHLLRLFCRYGAVMSNPEKTSS